MRPVAGYLHTNGLIRNNNLHFQRDNGLKFGKKTSYPQGRCLTTQAIYPAISASDFLRAVLQGESSLTNTGITMPVSMSATLTGNGTLTPDAEVGKTMWATITGAGSLSGDARMTVSMSATLDAGARPSAFDITQEILQAEASLYNAPGTIGNKINSAGAAGDPWGVDLSTYPPGTAGNIIYSLDPQTLADAILTDPRLLTVAKFLGLK